MAKIYIEKAIEYGEEPSAEVYEHYGDVLFMTGEQEKSSGAMEKAKRTGWRFKSIERKIREVNYKILF